MQSGTTRAGLEIYCYVGNRLTQANFSSASAFKLIVTAIGDEIWAAWQSRPNNFYIHPTGGPPPSSRTGFRQMFQCEIVDANTASVVSGALGIPIVSLTAGQYPIGTSNKLVTVNQSQLTKQQPNIEELVKTIE
jgi:hypothetical protein